MEMGDYRLKECGGGDGGGCGCGGSGGGAEAHHQEFRRCVPKAEVLNRQSRELRQRPASPRIVSCDCL
jgi:hypothetical protein